MRIIGILLACLLIQETVHAAAPEHPSPPLFRIGVAPHTSARIIIEMYQPLRNHLEQTLHQPVEILTAPDFTEFARRAMAKQYDLVVTTGHQVRLLQSDAAYIPLLTYQTDFRAVLLVAADSSYRRPADLAGTTIFGLSPSSLVTLWGQQWLHRNAVPNVTLSYTSASDSTVGLMLKGMGSAAFVSLPNYHSLPPALQEKVRFLDESLPMAGRVYALAPRHSARKPAVESALWAFARTPDAQTYFTRFKLGGYRALKPRELVEMEPYANEVRQLLKRP